MLAIGMSNTNHVFCGNQDLPPDCESEAFMTKALLDLQVNHDDLVIINGATGGALAAASDSPDDPLYNQIRDSSLFYYGMAELQVQVVWVYVANSTPTISLPDPHADAYFLMETLGDIARALRIRYPNVK